MKLHRAVALGALVALTALTLGPLVGVGAAGTGPRRRDDLPNFRLSVGGVAVAADESVDGPLVSIDGDATIDGTVDGRVAVINGDLFLTSDARVDDDVFVVRGDARINGTVDGHVVVLRGRAILGADARVTGDVRSTDDPRVADGARVRGDVEEIDIGEILRAIGVGLLIYWWIAVTVSTAILGAILLALFPRAMESSAAVGRSSTAWWRAALVGIALMIGLPIVAVLALVSLVGLPLGLGVFGSLGILHAIGYVAGAFFLGRTILRTQNRFGAFFVGWGILRIAAIIPGFGALVWIVAATYGVGMLAIVAFRAGRAKERPGEEPGPEPGPPPETEPERAPVAETDTTTETETPRDSDSEPTTVPQTQRDDDATVV
jgi:cytoskeletal protein CcmA (bactofilin family)